MKTKKINARNLLRVILTSSILLFGVTLYDHFGNRLGASAVQTPDTHTTVQTFNIPHGPSALGSLTGLDAVVASLTTYVYFADTVNHVIRRLSIGPGGGSDIIAGTEGVPGDMDGYLSESKLRYPTDVSVEVTSQTLYCQAAQSYLTLPKHTIYVSDTGNNKVRKISGLIYGCPSVSSNPYVSTEAGSGGTGMSNGSNLLATFNGPGSLLNLGNGNWQISDVMNHALRNMDSASVSTSSGNGSMGFADGYGTSARFAITGGMTRDSIGNLYVADIGNNAIRKVDSSGYVSTFAGQGPEQCGLVDGTGTAAKLFRPTSVVFNSADNYFYVADSHNNCIRKIDMSGGVTVYAGSSTGECGFADGFRTSARFSFPADLAIANGNLYVTDVVNNRIRCINFASGQVSTVFY
ncbi:MAG: hypothetical protein MN733_35670 [Nitrososphaera sp.]|nr:hypothetical protein [Nitrososphaera sp.]